MPFHAIGHQMFSISPSPLPATTAFQGLAVQRQSQQGFTLWFEIQFELNYLFESHNSQILYSFKHAKYVDKLLAAKFSS